MNALVLRLRLMLLVDLGVPPGCHFLFYTIPGKITQEFFNSKGKWPGKKPAGFGGERCIADTNIRRRNEALPENKKEK